MRQKLACLFVFVCVAIIAVACILNPQPEPPGADDDIRHSGDTPDGSKGGGDGGCESDNQGHCCDDCHGNNHSDACSPPNGLDGSGCNADGESDSTCGLDSGPDADVDPDAELSDGSDDSSDESDANTTLP